MENGDFVNKIGNTKIPVYYNTVKVEDILKNLKNIKGLKVNDPANGRYYGKIVRLRKNGVVICYDDKEMFIKFSEINNIHDGKLKLWSWQYAAELEEELKNNGRRLNEFLITGSR